MRSIFLFLAILIESISSAQTPQSSGDEYRNQGDLDAAIRAYKDIYSSTPSDLKNTYNLACAFALTFQKDSAYHYLQKGLIKDASLWALADSDLFALIDDDRWRHIEEEQIEKYQQINAKLKQPEYAIKLLRLIVKDQSLDYYIDQAKTLYMKHGNIPQWYYPLRAYKEQIGKENYNTMQQLLDQFGWPKYTAVGKLAADAPLMIINHHEDDSVRKQYLMQIKQACQENEGSCMEYAKIQDRILVNENKAQIYGMQFRYDKERKLEPFPILNPEYVDKRRKEIGLEPLKDYLKRKINYAWLIPQKMN